MIEIFFMAASLPPARRRVLLFLRGPGGESGTSSGGAVEMRAFSDGAHC
jgi:hypothetical protein